MTSRTMVLAVLAFVMAFALLGNSAVKKLETNLAMRKIIIAAVHLPAAELSIPVPCMRPPLAGDFDRALVVEELSNLHINPRLQATLLCLLGDQAGAVAAYDRAAAGGDSWPALQAYYLHTRSGEMVAAGRSLDEVSLSSNDLSRFYWAVVQFDQQVDLLPLARKDVEGEPANENAWRIWLDVGARQMRVKDYLKALDVYNEALSTQDRLGLQVGRSSFALNIGRIYQSYLEPRQVETALSYYDQALAIDSFIYLSDQAAAYLYRGEVYRVLRPKFTNSQVIAEFQHVLEIDPNNYWARLDLANVYLYDLKDPDRAEAYIRQAMALLPENPNAYLYLGDLYKQKGNLAQAAVAYQQALDHQPGLQSALARLAAVKAKMEQPAP